MRRTRAVLSAMTFLVAGALARSAGALDRFEVQVYEPDLNRPGQFGLELHSNYTLRGNSAPEYAGQVPPDRVARFTLEPALGVTNWLEVGAYLQAMIAPDVGAQWAGWKLRTKFVLPVELTTPWFCGINLELGRMPKRVEEEGWANEIRPFLGFNNGRILVDFNPILGYALTGPDKFKPDFEPAGKLSFNTQRGFSLGAEYYSSLGRFAKGFDVWKSQEHMLFGVFDLAPPSGADDEAGAWELNLGVGRSLTAAPGPEWLVKGIVGRAF